MGPDLHPPLPFFSALLPVQGSPSSLNSLTALGSRKLSRSDCLPASQLLAGSLLLHTSPPAGTEDKSDVYRTLARSQQKAVGSLQNLHFQQCFLKPVKS